MSKLFITPERAVFTLDTLKSFFSIRLDYIQQYLFSSKFFKDYSFFKRNNKYVREADLSCF